MGTTFGRPILSLAMILAIPLANALYAGDAKADDGVNSDDEAGRVVVLDSDEPRPFHEINADLRAFFRREAQSDSKEDQVAAILDLCKLYEELKRDPRVAESPTLLSYRNKAWSRLNKVKGEVERQIARQRRMERRNRYQPDPEMMAQVDQATELLAGQMSVLGHAYGGPSRIFSQASGAFGGGAIGDYGDDLVNLIQRTIDPEFWDIVGGPGSIMYYRPLHALVITATSEVHESIGGSLDALRKAGGR